MVQMGVDEWGNTLCWKGRRGAKLYGARELLEELLHDSRTGVPDSIIFHLGCNDLIQRSKLGFHLMVRDLVEFCQVALPHTIIMWSNILPRPYYEGAYEQAGMKAKLSEINRNASRQFERVWGKSIAHSAILPGMTWLFREDKLHLNEQGLEFFLSAFRSALGYFQIVPTAVRYPPV